MAGMPDISSMRDHQRDEGDIFDKVRVGADGAAQLDVVAVAEHHAVSRRSRETCRPSTR